MQFEIKINSSIVLGCWNEEDTTLSMAIESVFINLEKFTMKWHEHLLQISYNQDIADSIYDIISMLNSIKKKKQYHKIHFPSQHFFEVWECYTEEEMTTIKWLNDDDLTDVFMESQLFINEWIKLLEQIYNCLFAVGYNKKNLEDFHLLENISNLRK